MLEIKDLEIKGFNTDQINQIVKIDEELGIDCSNIPLTVPAEKMRDLRNMLPSFMPMQESCVINGLDAGVDVTIYANKAFSYQKMEIILDALKNDVDVIKYLELYPENDRIEELKLIFDSIAEGINPEKFESPEYDYEQKIQIKQGIKSKLDVDIYANPKYNADQMCSLYKALRSNVDVNVLLNEKYSFEEMEIIRYCLEKGYDIEKYVSPELTLEQLEQIKKGFENKVDVSIFANKEYSWIRMKAIRKVLQYNKEHNEKVSYEIYLLDLNDKKIEEIRNVIKNGTLEDKFAVYNSYGLNYIEE